jgi:kynurenine formamidase
MIATIEHEGRTWRVELGNPVDLSITLEFAGPQPNAFGLPKATSQPFRAGPFVGDTREGGSVNCETVTLNPHGNGTHTECVGHIVNERVPVSDILQDTLVPAVVVTVRPVRLADSGEAYAAVHDDSDQVVTASSLHRALSQLRDLEAHALVVRTLPNGEEKRAARHSGNNPVYFTTDAMRAIRQHNVKHLLVDFPSVDREEDDGLLPNHHIFWEVPAGTHHLVNVPSSATITEMVYVPDVVADGPAFLTIQIPDWALDAAPSRPRLFPAQIMG